MTLDPTTTLDVVRQPGGERVDDTLAVEEPLEIRVDDDPLAVLMRTPGDDEALVAGFLWTEGVIDGADDLTALGPCRDPNVEHGHNVWRVRLASGLGPRLERARREFFATSSCGLCGKATIDNVMLDVTPHDAFLPLPAELAGGASDRARRLQRAFAETGGLHAAVLFDAGDLAIIGGAEDVGRHNAVDKVLGARLLADEVPLGDAALWVSGRASFEVIQKALVAGVRAVIGVGAPTSLAVDLARRGRLTLVGFARDGRWNVYAG